MVNNTSSIFNSFQRKQQLKAQSESLRNDVHNHKFPQKEVAYVVGAADTLADNDFEALKRIDRQYPTVVVNSAVKIDFPWTYAMFFDLGLPKISWFKELNFSDRNIVCIMGNGIADPRANYTFKYRPTITKLRHKNDPEIPNGVLSGSATISACAIQFAIKILGAKKVILAGINLMGKTHFDGTFASDNVIWTQTASFQWLIDYYVDRGIRFYSLTPCRFENIEKI